jgi:hypothetical protein
MQRSPTYAMQNGDWKHALLRPNHQDDFLAAHAAARYRLGGTPTTRLNIVANADALS